LTSMIISFSNQNKKTDWVIHLLRYYLLWHRACIIGNDLENLCYTILFFLHFLFFPFLGLFTLFLISLQTVVKRLPSKVLQNGGHRKFKDSNYSTLAFLLV
jgi:hypothetical protein